MLSALSKFCLCFIFLVAFIMTVNFSGHFFTTCLKFSMRDTTCNKHSNSVSGHTFYWCFALLSLAYLHLSQIASPSTRSTGRRRRKQKLKGCDAQGLLFHGFFFILYIPFAYMAFINLRDTLVMGFHSPRQMLYGFLLALWLNYFLVFWSDGQIYSSSSKKSHDKVALPILAFSVGSILWGLLLQRTIAGSDRGRTVLDVPSLLFTVFCWFLLLLQYRSRKGKRT